MNSDPLQKLRDLQLGEPIGAWPLAYGWYLLAIFILIIVTIVIMTIYKRYQINKPKRLALKQLCLIEKVYQLKPEPHKTAYQLTVLLKRLCFAYYPREKVASLYGEKWYQFLGQQDWAEQLSRLNYQKPTCEDVSALFPKIRHWIKNCNKRNKNV